MIVIGNLFIALSKVLNLALVLYLWLIVIRAVLSWVNIPYHPLIGLVYGLTDPVLLPIRRWTFQVFPRYNLPVDISPIFAILLIYFLKIFLVSSLWSIGHSLKGGF